MREFHLDSGDRGSQFEPSLNRDRLCCQRSRRSSISVSEVQSRVVVRRRGGGAYVCMMMVGDSDVVNIKVSLLRGL